MRSPSGVRSKRMRKKPRSIPGRAAPCGVPISSKRTRATTSPAVPPLLQPVEVEPRLLDRVEAVQIAPPLGERRAAVGGAVPCRRSGTPRCRPRSAVSSRAERGRARCRDSRGVGAARRVDVAGAQTRAPARRDRRRPAAAVEELAPPRIQVGQRRPAPDRGRRRDRGQPEEQRSSCEATARRSQNAHYEAFAWHVGVGQNSARPRKARVSARSDEHDDRLRYAAAACQVDFPNPADRAGIKAHVDRMLAMIEQAVMATRRSCRSSWWSSPSSRMRRRSTRPPRELLDKLALPIPNEHTERYAAKAKEYGIYDPDRHLPGARRPLARVWSSTPPA